MLSSVCPYAFLCWCRQIFDSAHIFGPWWGHILFSDKVTIFNAISKFHTVDSAPTMLISMISISVILQSNQISILSRVCSEKTTTQQHVWRSCLSTTWPSAEFLFWFLFYFIFLEFGLLRLFSLQAVFSIVTYWPHFWLSPLIYAFKT